MKKILLSASLFVGAILIVNAQDFVKSDFLAGYSVGQDLEKYAYTLADSANATRNPKLDQWNLTVKTTDQDGSSPVIVDALTYAGYIGSGSDSGVKLSRITGTARVCGYSMVDDNDYSEGAYYTAFLVKPTEVTSGNTGNGQDFFTLDGNTFVNNQRARIFLRRGPSYASSNQTFSLGLSEDGTTGSFHWDSNEYPVNSTVLVVLKYDFTGAKVSLFVNPDLSKTEAENTAIASYTATNGLKESAGIRALILKQRTANQMEISGIRFTNVWEGVNNEIVPNSIIGETADKGNVVSVKYYNLSGVEVNEPVNTNNVYVKKAIYEDGSVETTKVVK